MLRVGDARMRPWSNRLQTHQLHQSLNSLVVDLMTLCPQPISHARRAAIWLTQILLVDQTHQGQIFIGFGYRLVVKIPNGKCLPACIAAGWNTPDPV